MSATWVRRACTLFVVVAAVLLTLSCGEEPMDTITVQEADARVEQHIRAVAVELPSARLEERRPPRVSQCNQPLDGGPLGRVYASRFYWIRDVPTERNDELFEAALRYWADSGYRVLTDHRPRDDFVRVEAPDFTTIAIQASVDASKTMSIVSSSPCVWPDGTPAPTG